MARSKKKPISHSVLVANRRTGRLLTFSEADALALSAADWFIVCREPDGLAKRSKPRPTSGARTTRKARTCFCASVPMPIVRLTKQLRRIYRENPGFVVVLGQVCSVYERDLAGGAR